MALSLKMRLTLLVAGLLAVISVVVVLGFDTWSNQAAREWARRRAAGISRVLASAMRAALDFDDAAEARRLIGLSSGPDVSYGEVRRSDGTVLTAWQRDVPDDAPAQPRPAIDLSVPAGADHALRDEGSVVHLVTLVQTTDPDTREKKVLGMLRLDFSLAELEEEQTRNLALASLAAVLIAFIGSLLAFLLGHVVARPIRSLTKVTTEIAERGDLRLRIPVESDDEVGLLARSFERMVAGQRALLFALRNSVDGFGEVIDLVRGAGRTVADSAANIEARVEENAAAVNQMQRSLGDVAGNVQSLHATTRQGATAIMQMVQNNDDVAASVGSMAESVQASTQSVSQLTSSIQTVARSIEELGGAVTGTVTSMQEIQRSIDAVEQNASATAQLSRQASNIARHGRDAMSETVRSIEDIRGQTKTISDVMIRLQMSIGDIHGMAELISDFAHQTNLLALNAGIIASHAGEHGAAFNVVAAEIKRLADRTRSSTEEISTVIARIKEESQTAVGAMDAGLRSVEEGARVGRAAGEVLEQILDSSEASSRRMQAIADATVEEARQTRHVGTAFERIGRSLQDITQAARQQAADSDVIGRNTSALNTLTQTVRLSSQQQTAGSAQITKAIDDINRLVALVHSAQQQQTTSAEVTLRSVQTIRESCRRQDELVRRLEKTIESLHGRADALHDVMGRFRV